MILLLSLLKAFSVSGGKMDKVIGNVVFGVVIAVRGKKALMVGYVNNSAGGTYRMYNIETSKISNTRDVKWTNKSLSEMMNFDKYQSDYNTASEEDETDSGSCGESVIFPHLVGFHSSRQNIY